MTSENLIGRRVLDVSKLPATRFDEKSMLWWGNNWGLAIETAVFGILVALYFSVRMSISQWLPPRTTARRSSVRRPVSPFREIRCQRISPSHPRGTPPTDRKAWNGQQREP